MGLMFSDGSVFPADGGMVRENDWIIWCGVLYLCGHLCCGISFHYVDSSGDEGSITGRNRCFLDEE